MRRRAAWWRSEGGRLGKARRRWRRAATELVDRLAVVLRICPWGWHRPVPRERVAQRVEKAYGCGPFRALWAVEAVGFRYADTSPRLAAGKTPLPLPAAELPRESLLMLHVGLGMALAKRDLADGRRAIDTPAAVHRFLSDARASALPGFLDAVAEPLGLVARFEHPRRVAIVGQALAEQAPELVPWFWHGVGRCLLFLPETFLPRAEASWLAALRLAREVRPAEHRRMARVGWACGLTLVHMRNPWLVADLLRRHGGEIEGSRDGFADDFREGVAEAVEVRREVTPGCDELVRAYLAHLPPGRRAAERWRRLVERPGNTALAAPAGVETALSRRRVEARRLAAAPAANGGTSQLVLDFERSRLPRRPAPRRMEREALLISRA